MIWLSLVRFVTCVDRFLTVPFSLLFSSISVSICAWENSKLAFSSLRSVWSSSSIESLLLMDDSTLTSIVVSSSVSVDESRLVFFRVGLAHDVHVVKIAVNEGEYVFQVLAMCVI